MNVELFLRDASWHPRSKPGGKTPVYHVGREGDLAMAHCSTLIMLITEAPVDVRDLKESEICRRCWPEVKRRLAVSPLTEQEWRDVFKIRCRSKEGKPVSTEERALTNRAYREDVDRYSAMEADVFDATVPFGSNVRSKR